MDARTPKLPVVLTPAQSAYARAPNQRRKMMLLDRAARQVADPRAKPNEKAAGIYHIQVALGIDPNLVFEVLTSVLASGVSSADIEKLKQDAAKFDGVVQSVEALHTTVTEIGAIKKGDRLPGTAEEWKGAIGNVVAKLDRRRAAQEAHLAQLKSELEAQRTKVLGEIKQAHTALQETTQAKAPLLSRLSMGMFAPLKGRVAQAEGAISSLSFDYDHIEPPEVGQLIAGEGVFTTLWTPKYKNGKPLGIECELYSAPEDLRHAPGVNGPQTYLNSVRAVAGLRNWYGHDGGDFANDKAVMSFLDKTLTAHQKKHGPAEAGIWFRPDGIGKWFIPFGEHVDGKVENRNGNRVKTYHENHYDLKNTGAFAGTFTTTSGSDDAVWYWSSTEHRVSPDFAWLVRFSDGADAWILKDLSRLSSRPVRVGRVRHLVI